MLNQITHHHLQIAVVKPQERLDAVNAPQLWAEMESLLNGETRHVVIDLSAVSFADSAAIAVLVRTLKLARRQNGSLKLVWPPTSPSRRIFDLTQFDQIFNLFPSVEDALQVY